MPDKDVELIIAGRSAGKTTRCIELAAEKLAYIVCPNRKDVRRIDRKAKEMGHSIPFPLTADEFFRGQFYGRGITAFVVDDVDRILGMYAGMVPIIGISLTHESEHFPDSKPDRKENAPQHDDGSPPESTRTYLMNEIKALTARLSEEQQARVEDQLRIDQLNEELAQLKLRTIPGWSAEQQDTKCP